MYQLLFDDMEHRKRMPEGKKTQVNINHPKEPATGLQKGTKQIIYQPEKQKINRATSRHISR
jgi:hypothetical protein